MVFVVVIDGPQGVGKTTFLNDRPLDAYWKTKYLLENTSVWHNFPVLMRPRDEEDVVDYLDELFVNLLDQSKISPLIRQKYILMNLAGEIERARADTTETDEILVIERGFLGWEVFTRMDRERIPAKGWDELKALYEYMYTESDLRIVMLPPKDVALSRAKARKRPIDERLDADFFSRSYDAYARSLPGTGGDDDNDDDDSFRGIWRMRDRTIVVDTTAPKEVVYEKIRDAIATARQTKRG